MATTLTLGKPTPGQPGDTFEFVPPSASKQYHFAVTPGGPAAVLGLWRNAPGAPNGVARNKPGLNYVDHVCGSGKFVLTVAGLTAPYTVTVTPNSFWKQAFGW